MVWLRLLETPGVFIPRLKWSMFWLVNTEKNSEGFVMVLLAPVGWELLSRMGIPLFGGLCGVHLLHRF